MLFIRNVQLIYLHFLSLMTSGLWPNITAPFNTAIPASTGTITLLLENLQFNKNQENKINEQYYEYIRVSYYV